MHRIFVYGTLMSGERNHRLMTTAQFVRVAWTRPEYTLVSFGAFPALIEGGTTAVRGEIYEVDAPTLAALDRLEGHPRFYVRKPVRLRRGKRVEAYVFPNSRRSKHPEIVGGDWRQRAPTRT